jgi:XTP/dITP diphosphohydrolase
MYNKGVFMKCSDEIIFVTHNKGKVKSAEKYLKNIEFLTYDYELDEPRSDDIKLIAKAKVMEAYEMVKKPCLAMDADFYIDELNGFPKAFVNFALDTIGVDGILKLMEGKKNRRCAFRQCVAFFDGQEIYYFYGESKGSLSLEKRGIDTEKKWSDLWYIFIPQGFNKTLAEMSDDERDNKKLIDKSTNALEEFAKWYQKFK